MDERRKNYRAWDPQQCCQISVSPREALPEDDLVYFLLDVMPQLDLSPFHQHYAQEMRGQPPFDVTMMVTLVVYAYSVGVCSSRKIASACQRNLAFRAILGEDPPDFRTISDFRKIHQAAFRPLFLEVLRLAGEMGMVKLGNLSTDGTKMGANASRHKAMSYGYMNKDIERLKGEIEQLLKQAEQADAEQDGALGSRRGDELPDELKRREDRLAKIQEAKTLLEAEARVKAEEEQRCRNEEQAKREAEGRQRRGKEPAPIDSTPEEVYADRRLAIDRRRDRPWASLRVARRRLRIRGQFRAGIHGKCDAIVARMENRFLKFQMEFGSTLYRTDFVAGCSRIGGCSATSPRTARRQTPARLLHLSAIASHGVCGLRSPVNKAVLAILERSRWR